MWNALKVWDAHEIGSCYSEALRNFFSRRILKKGVWLWLVLRQRGDSKAPMSGPLLPSVKKKMKVWEAHRARWQSLLERWGVWELATSPRCHLRALLTFLSDAQWLHWPPTASPNKSFLCPLFPPNTQIQKRSNCLQSKQLDQSF